MNKYLLMTSMVILGLGNISESIAEKICNCGSTTNGGSASDCCWEIDSNGVLYITAADGKSNVKMRNYNETILDADPNNGYPTPQWGSDAPWQRQGVTSVVISEGISKIGDQAFRGDKRITSVDMPKVTEVGTLAFYATSSLESVDMPEVATIGRQAFGYTNGLTSVNMPNVTSIGEKAFMDDTYLSYVGFNPDKSGLSIGSDAFKNTPLRSCTKDNYAGCTSCTSNQAYQVGNGCVESCLSGYTAINGLCKKMPGCVNYADGACQECDSDYLTNSSGTCTPAADCKNGFHADGGACVANPQGCNTFEDDRCTECNSGLFKQDGDCVSSCGASFKLNDGECDRIRYTPAEAAQVLHDDNTNSVTITFKK